MAIRKNMSRWHYENEETYLKADYIREAIYYKVMGSLHHRRHQGGMSRDPMVEWGMNNK